MAFLLVRKDTGGIEYTMRKSYDTSFKAKVAMEAVRNEKTLQELSQIYGVHPNQIAQWKKHVVEQVATLFERSGKDKDAEAAQEKQDELFKQIGQLQVENAFLKKKYRQVYGSEPPL